MTSLISNLPSPNPEEKYCANCLHLIGVRYHTEDLEKWHCGHKLNLMEVKINLVTGLARKVFIGPNITNVRYNNCKGDWYEKYEQPNFSKHLAMTAEEPMSQEALDKNRAAAEKKLAEIKAKKKLATEDLDNL